MRTIIIALSFLLFLWCNLLFANISAPPEPFAGNIIGTSPMKNIAVLHEDLTMNFNDIVHRGFVHVFAKYKINCLTQISLLDLVFVANNLKDSRYKVTIDNNLINGQLLPMDSIPKSWLPPDSIKWEDKTIPYKYDSKGLISFRIDTVTLGEHILEVSYDAEASSWFDNNELAQFRTLVYILKPSDSWENFGSINLKLVIPESWDISSNLTFNKDKSNVFEGHWAKLPSDFVSIAIQKSTVEAKIASGGFQIICWGAITLLVIWCLSRFAKYRIDGKVKGIGFTLGNAFVASFIISIAFYVIYFTHFNILSKILEDDLNPMLTHGLAYSIFGFPLIWILAFVLILMIDTFITDRLKQKVVHKRTATNNSIHDTRGDGTNSAVE